jgi:hypothetical protein
MAEIFKVLFVVALLASHSDTREQKQLILDVTTELSIISVHEVRSRQSGA